MEIKKEDLIQHGLTVFQSVGSHYICEVCINSGNSCCFGCQHLEEGIGCQKRNTSCTAWLCGLQKFYFNEIGLLDEWKNLWEQIPGQYFREDDTPEVVTISSLIHYKHFDGNVGKKMAERLEVIVKEGGNLDKVERHLNQIIELGEIYNSHPLYKLKLSLVWDSSLPSDG